MQSSPDSEEREERNGNSPPVYIFGSTEYSGNSGNSGNYTGDIYSNHAHDFAFAPDRRAGNRSQPSSRDSDAPTVASSLQQGRRRRRSANERKKHVLRALKDLREVRSLADNKRLSAKKKSMISDLTYRPEEVIKDLEHARREIADLRAEVQDLRAENEDLRGQVAMQQSTSARDEKYPMLKRDEQKKRKAK